MTIVIVRASGKTCIWNSFPIEGDPFVIPTEEEDDLICVLRPETCKDEEE